MIRALWFRRSLAKLTPFQRRRRRTYHIVWYWP